MDYIITYNVISYIFLYKINLTLNIQNLTLNIQMYFSCIILFAFDFKCV